ncbi:MAG: 2-C-methyl-D-erythritol 4-phosphate cytidylyltransferase [bacterium]|nr:2-C-methyl-D-erythritol 4-phosphate cytidylyltransferase [bacterium]
MSPDLPPLHLLVVAGGRGLRAAGGGEIPKQFRPTGRGMLLRVAVDTFVAGEPGTAVPLVSLTITAPAPGVPVHDTIVHSEQGRARYLARETLLAVQTPQVFRWEQLREAHAWAAASHASFTDDGGLLAARGHDPAVVEGEIGNWKITTEGDWRRAADLLGE